MISYRHVRIPARAARAATLGILLSAFAVGCATPSAAPQPAVDYPDYLVGAPDQLSITVLPEPTITETAVVRPDGKITIQLIGDVQAAGRSPKEIGTEIEEKISRFKRGARATVALLAATSSAITVLGEVRSPGTFPVLKQTRVAEALGSAGGTTSFASLGGIHVVRGSESTARVIPVDLTAIRQGDMSSNVQVRPGDIIYVPPTVWAQVGYAVQAVLFPFQPFLGLATSAAGSAIAN